MRSILLHGTLGLVLVALPLGCELAQRTEYPSFENLQVSPVHIAAFGLDTLDVTVHVDRGSFEVSGVRLEYVIHERGATPFQGAELASPMVTEVAVSQNLPAFYGQSLLEGAERLSGKVVTFRWVLNYRTPGGADSGIASSPFYRTSPFRPGAKPSVERVAPPA